MKHNDLGEGPKLWVIYSPVYGLFRRAGGCGYTTDVTQAELLELPDIEVVSANVHAAWMDSKAAQGVTSRKAEDGEELMVAYEQLSNKAQELDRGTVRAVYAAILAASDQA